MNRAVAGIGIVVVAVVFAAGCDTTSKASRTYTRGQAQTAMQVYYGTVLSVAEVTIEADETGAGAVGGAAAGSAAERARGRRAGIEIEVEVDDGRIMVIAQEKDDQYAVGERVRIIQGRDGAMRVRQQTFGEA